MCGICGIINFRNDKAIKKETIHSMCELIKHRGPDNEGIYVKGGVGMGIRRLSIIDLDTGNQPILNEDGNLVVVCNGEIYNYIELRKSLKGLGHKFLTFSDVEVIPHLFEEYGVKAFRMLNGFFTFSLWDKRSKRMYLVRDRWGIKPLFYFNGYERLIFGSEIKCFKALEEKFPLDLTAMWDYFSYGYSPAQSTFLKGVKQLSAGCYLSISGNRAEECRYSQIKKNQKYKNISLCEAKEVFSVKIENAIKLSIRSDVPVGIFLSAGLDSNLIFYEAMKFLKGKINTYTISVKDGLFDEAQLVKQMLGRYKVNSEFLTLTPAWIEDNFSKISYYHDSLAFTPAFMAVYLLSEAASKNIKVALVGAAGDELAMGYPTYQADLLWRHFHRLPDFVKKQLNHLSGSLPAFSGRIGLDYKLKKFTEGLRYNAEKAHYSWRTIFTENEKSRLLRKDFFPKNQRDSFEAYKGAFRAANPKWDFLSKASFADMKIWLTQMGQLQTDTFTMCNSLETRPPLLENDLAEFLFSMPMALKMSRFQTKYFFRQYYKSKLPGYITNKSKMGLHLPMAKWFRGELKDFAYRHLFSNEYARMFFNKKYLMGIFDEHVRGSEDNNFKIWTLVCFTEWFKHYGTMIKW